MTTHSRVGTDVYESDREYHASPSSRRDRPRSRAPPTREVEEVEIRAGRRGTRDREQPEFLREDYARRGESGQLVIRERSRSRERGGGSNLEVKGEVRIRSHSHDPSRRERRREGEVVQEEVVIKSDRERERVPRERGYEEVVYYPEPDYRPPQIAREREDFVYRERDRRDGREEVFIPPPVRDPRGQDVRFEREEYDFRPRIRDPSPGVVREELVIRDEERDRPRYRETRDEEIIIRDRERERPRYRDERDEEVIIRREERSRERSRRDFVEEDVNIRERDAGNHLTVNIDTRERSRTRGGGYDDYRDDDYYRRDERDFYRRRDRSVDRNEEDIIVRHRDSGRGRHDDEVIIRKNNDRSPSPDRFRPPIHQEVITHHRHIDHGYEREGDERLEIRHSGTARNGRHYDDDIIFQRETGNRRRLEGVHRGHGGEDSRELALIDTRDRGRRFEGIPDARDRMWTEITRDLVSEEAIREKGYEYEETPEFFFVMEYLRYEDVLALVELTEEIQYDRRRRIREMRDERDFIRDDARPRQLTGGTAWDEERVIEREVVYDGAGSRRYR